MQAVLTLARPHSTQELEEALKRVIVAQSERPWRPMSGIREPHGNGWSCGDVVTLSQRSCQPAGNISLLTSGKRVSFKRHNSYIRIIVEPAKGAMFGQTCCCHVAQELDGAEVFDVFVGLLKNELGISE